jgi:hypothetical protein
MVPGKSTLARWTAARALAEGQQLCHGMRGRKLSLDEFQKMPSALTAREKNCKQCQRQRKAERLAAYSETDARQDAFGTGTVPGCNREPHGRDSPR